MQWPVWICGAYLLGFLINDSKFECVLDIMLIIGPNHLGGLENVGRKKSDCLLT